MKVQYRKVSTSVPEMTSSATSGRLQIAFMSLLPSSTSPSQNDPLGKSRKALTLAPSKYNATLDSLYISTKNDVITYFQSAANQIQVFIFGHAGVTISIISQRFTVLEMTVQLLNFQLCNPAFLLLGPEE